MRRFAVVAMITLIAATAALEGWSHRAAGAFGIGDKLFSGEAMAKLQAELGDGADEVPFVQIGDKVIDSDDEARQAATNFAAYVS